MSRTKGSKNKPKELIIVGGRMSEGITTPTTNIPTKEKPEKITTRGRSLTAYELETVINFNKGEDEAVVFTYEGTWQRHIEKRMGIQPYLDNGFGGKSYKIPKKRIRKPLPFRTGKKKIMTKEQMAKMQAGRKGAVGTT